MLSLLPLILVAAAPLVSAANEPICGYFYESPGTSDIVTLGNATRVSRGLDCPANPGTVTITNPTNATNAFSLTCQNACAVAVEGVVNFNTTNNRSIDIPSLYPVIGQALNINFTQNLVYELPASGQCIPAGQSGYYEVVPSIMCVSGYFNRCVTTILRDDEYINVCGIVWANNDPAAGIPQYELAYVTTGGSANVTASTNPATATAAFTRLAATSTAAAATGRAAGYAGVGAAGIAAAAMILV